MKKLWILLLPVGLALMLLGGGLWFFCLQMGAAGYQTSIGNLCISFGKYGIQVGPVQDLNMDSDDLESSRVPLERKITGLDLELPIADVTITQNGGEGYIEWTDIPKGRLQQEVKDGILQVETSSPKYFLGWGFSDNTQDCSLVINLPPETALSDTTIEAGIGNLQLEGITAGRLEIEGGVGNVTLAEVTASSIELTGNMGNISAENVVCQGEMKLSAGIGNIALSGILQGDLELECGVGDVSLSLDGDIRNYQFDIIGGIGTASINDEVSVTMTDYHSLNTDAPYKISVDGGVGNVTINIG